MKKEFWRTLWRVLLWMFIFLTAQIIGAVLVIAQDTSIMKLDSDEIGERVGNSTTFALAALLGNVLIALLFFGRRYVTLSPGCLERQSLWKLAGMLALATVSFLFIDLSVIDLPYYHNLFPEEWAEFLADDTQLNVFSLIDGCLTGPIAEEICFRGVILGGLLCMRCRPWLAILISAMAFGAMHGSAVKFLGCTGFGVIVGWLFWRTRSILPGIAVHIAYNTITLVFSIIAERFVNTSESYSPSTMFDLIFIAIALPVLLLALRRMDGIVPKTAINLPT